MRYHVISTVGDLRFERTLEWDAQSAAEAEQARAVMHRDFPPCNSVPLPDVTTPTTVVNPPDLRQFARELLRIQRTDSLRTRGVAQ